MPERYRTACVSPTGRLSNDEFSALMVGVVGRIKGSSRQLFLAASPLLIAFYGGQVQAGRAETADLKPLLLRARAALYQARASFASDGQPFRAWLLDIARVSMTDYFRGRAVHAITHAPERCIERKPVDGRALDKACQATSPTGFGALDQDAKAMKKFAELA